MANDDVTFFRCSCGTNLFVKLVALSAKDGAMFDGDIYGCWSCKALWLAADGRLELMHVDEYGKVMKQLVDRELQAREIWKPPQA